MKHLLITGGAGFIGSNLIKHLFHYNSDIQITCIDNFDPFYSEKIKEYNIRDFKNPQFKLLRLDLGEMEGIDLWNAVPDPVDAVIHLAAKAGVRPSIKNPMLYQKANVIGLQNILDFAKARSIKQFVFASSSSVYGVNDHFPWKEDEQLMPISPYAMTKLSGELLGHVYSHLFGIRFIALRFFTVYGPGQRPDLAIHKFTKSMLTEKPITVYGDGSTSRDYTFIDDIVKGIESAMQYEKTNFEIINLGNNYTISLIDLIKAMEETIGTKAIIEYFPEQPGDVPRTFADINKAKRLLGYNPETRLEVGLQHFHEWFLEHKDLLLQ